MLQPNLPAAPESVHRHLTIRPAGSPDGHERLDGLERFPERKARHDGTCELGAVDAACAQMVPRASRVCAAIR
jgi:hypothetical protein